MFLNVVGATCVVAGIFVTAFVFWKVMNSLFSVVEQLFDDTPAHHREVARLKKKIRELEAEAEKSKSDICDPS